MAIPLYKEDIIPAQNRAEITTVNDSDLLVVSQANVLKKITKTNFKETAGINAKVSKTDIVDNLTSTDVDKPLSANRGRELNESVSTNATNIANEILRAKGAETTNATNISTNATNITKKVNTSDIIDSLDDTSPDKPLSAKQGNVLGLRDNALLERSVLQYYYGFVHPSRIEQLSILDASKTMYFKVAEGRFNFSWNNPSGRLWTFPNGTVLYSDGVTPIASSTDQKPDVTIPTGGGVVTLTSDSWSGDYGLSSSDMSTSFVGDLSDLPALSSYLNLTKCSLMTGDLSDLPALSHTINLGRCSSVTGDLSDLPVVSNILGLDGCSLLTGAYTQVSGDNMPSQTYFSNMNISPTDIDATLIAYASCTKDNGIFGAYNMGRTSASDTAVANLTARGWVVSGLTVV